MGLKPLSVGCSLPYTTNHRLPALLVAALLAGVVLLLFATEEAQRKTPKASHSTAVSGTASGGTEVSDSILAPTASIMEKPVPVGSFLSCNASYDDNENGITDQLGLFFAALFSVPLLARLGLILYELPKPSFICCLALERPD